MDVFLDVSGKKIPLSDIYYIGIVGNPDAIDVGGYVVVEYLDRNGKIHRRRANDGNNFLSTYKSLTGQTWTGNNSLLGKCENGDW